MRIIFLLQIILFSLSAIGQESNSRLNSEDLDDLYYLAIKYNLNYALMGGPIYFEHTQFTQRIIDRPGIYYRFYSSEELVKKARKFKIKAYRYIHNSISQDTIDFNICIVHVSTKRKIHFNKGIRFIKSDFSVDCRKKSVEPDIRFIYNEFSNKWRMIKNLYGPIPEE